MEQAHEPHAMLHITDTASGAVLLHVGDGGAHAADATDSTTTDVTTTTTHTADAASSSHGAATLLECADAGAHEAEYDALLDFLTRAQQACYAFFGKHARAGGAVDATLHSMGAGDSGGSSAAAAGVVSAAQRRRGVARNSSSSPRHTRQQQHSPSLSLFRPAGIDGDAVAGVHEYADGDDAAGCATEESSLHITSSAWSECEAIGAGKPHSQQQQQQQQQNNNNKQGDDDDAAADVYNVDDDDDAEAEAGDDSDDVYDHDVPHDY